VVLYEFLSPSDVVLAPVNKKVKHLEMKLILLVNELFFLNGNDQSVEEKLTFSALKVLSV